MKFGTWPLAVLLLGCIGAATASKPSPAGLTTIMVRGDACDVVLVDPRGRVSRSNERKGDVIIPECNRWDGGTETFLDDSTGGDNEPQSDVVTTFELANPIVGRYRLYAKATAAGSMTVVVTPVRLMDVKQACHEMKREIAEGAGRYRWNIDFSADSSQAMCPVRLLGPIRSSTKQ